MGFTRTRKPATRPSRAGSRKRFPRKHASRRRGLESAPPLPRYASIGMLRCRRYKAMAIRSDRPGVVLSFERRRWCKCFAMLLLVQRTGSVMPADPSRPRLQVSIVTETAGLCQQRRRRVRARHSRPWAFYGVATPTIQATRVILDATDGALWRRRMHRQLTSLSERERERPADR